MSRRTLYCREVQSCEIGEVVREAATGLLWKLTQIKDDGRVVLARKDGVLPVRVVPLGKFFDEYDGYRGWYNYKQDEPMVETFTRIIKDKGGTTK